MDRHGSALVLFARSWCRCPEDVVSVAFGKLARLTTLPDDPAAWLFTVVRNAAKDAAKAERRRVLRERAVAMPEVWFAQSPWDGLDSEAATIALRELPEDQREIIIARLWGGLTLEQIASAMDCSISTAHRRYEAGIAALQERFGVS